MSAAELANTLTFRRDGGRSTPYTPPYSLTGTYPGEAEEGHPQHVIIKVHPHASAFYTTNTLKSGQPSNASKKQKQKRVPHLCILDRVQQVLQVFSNIAPSPPQDSSKIVPRAQWQYSQRWPLLPPSYGIHGLGNPPQGYADRGVVIDIGESERSPREPQVTLLFHTCIIYGWMPSYFSRCTSINPAKI